MRTLPLTKRGVNMVLLRSDNDEVIKEAQELLEEANINYGEMWAMRGKYVTCSADEFYEAIAVLKERITKDKAITFY